MLLFFCHPRTEWQSGAAGDERGLSDAPRQCPHKMLSSIITGVPTSLKSPDCASHGLRSLKWTDIEMRRSVM